MLSKRDTGRQPDFDQIMIGTCATCGNPVEVEYWQSQIAKSHGAIGFEPGVWTDLRYAECQNKSFGTCGTCGGVGEVANGPNDITDTGPCPKCEGTGKAKCGARVYLIVKPKEPT